MKNKFLFIALMVALFTCLFAFSASAAVTIYDDAPARTNIIVSTDDVVVFDDGFTCPSAYVFLDSKTTPDGAWNVAFEKAMDFTYINGKTGKTYKFSNVVELDIPQGITYVGKYSAYNVKTLKRVSFPDSVTSLGQSIFEGASGLEECVFEHDVNDNLKTIPTYMFANNTSLKAISLPDCVTAIKGVYQFSGCTNLTAVHLPANLEVMEGGSQRQATFDGCSKMYFVNEPFTYDAIPAKPDVYYFPKNFTTIGDGCIFRSCNSLNAYLVFDTAMTNIKNLYTFENTAKSTLVFLGDMENLLTGGWKTNNIIFANKNDIDDATAGLTRAGKDGSRDIIWSGTAYFCYAADNTTHFAEKTVDAEAKCGIDAAKVTLCFCGHEITREAVLGTALSHDYDYYKNENAVLISIAYETYGEKGTKVVSCGLCGEHGTVEASALFVSLGYSAPEDGRGALAIGFLINTYAIEEYEKITGISLAYGGFAVLKDRIGDNDIFDENGSTISGVVSAEIAKQTVTAFELKIMGFETDEHKALEIAMGTYVVETDTEGNCKYLYIQDSAPSAGAKYTFTTYNENV